MATFIFGENKLEHPIFVMFSIGYKYLCEFLNPLKSKTTAKNIPSSYCTNSKTPANS